MNPAKEVGGDLYDFFLIDTNRLGFIIGDVSGKGVPAAMLMAVSKTLLKATALKGIPPDNCLETVNNLLVEDSLSHMFVTVFYGILDARNGALEYCNGGHNPPFLISDGKVNALKHTGGLVVGAIKNTEYESNLISLQPGDTLFLYTDGVTEAENKERDEYQEQRLEDALVEVRSAEIDEIVEHILAEVNTFSEGMQQSDDITCLAVKYLGR
jgi:sigma-B regulation protein RsbU (phosphoserine phosphatase)